MQNNRITVAEEQRTSMWRQFITQREAVFQHRYRVQKASNAAWQGKWHWHCESAHSQLRALPCGAVEEPLRWSVSCVWHWQQLSHTTDPFTNQTGSISFLSPDHKLQRGTAQLHDMTTSVFLLQLCCNPGYWIFTVLAVDIQTVTFLQYPLTRCGDRRLQGVCHRPGLSARHCEHDHLTVTLPLLRRGKGFAVAHSLSCCAEDAPPRGQILLCAHKDLLGPWASST